jgi:hypothetical protein
LFKKISIASARFLAKISELRELIIKPVYLGDKEIYSCEESKIHQFNCQNQFILVEELFTGSQS